MLPAQGGGMGVVVGDLPARQAAVAGPAGAVVATVGIMQDELGAHAIQPGQGLDLPREGLLGAQRRQLADVRRQHQPRIPAQADRVLLLGAHGEQGPGQAPGQLELEGGAAPSRTQRARPAGDGPPDAIIHRVQDGAVMVQEGIGHPAQALLCHGPVGDNRLAGDIGRGSDQRARQGLHQQVVQGRIGQQHADLAEPGGEGRLEPVVGPQREQHHRPLVGEQGLGGCRVQPGMAAHDLKAILALPRDHHGERLVRPMLALAQGRQRRRVAGIGHQVVATDSLHGDDPAFGQRRDGGRQRLPGIRERPVALHAPLYKRQPGPALRAADRLGMEASALRVVVFPPALGAERKGLEAGARPVVGQSFDHAVARAALVAVGEGVAVVAVLRVVHLRQAVLAHRGVQWQVDRAARLAVALPDHECSGGGRRDLLRIDRLAAGDARARQPRSINEQGPLEGIQPVCASLGLDHHLAAAVAHLAREVQPAGQSLDEGPEPHALDHAGQHPASCLLVGGALDRGDGDPLGGRVRRRPNAVAPPDPAGALLGHHAGAHRALGPAGAAVEPALRWPDPAQHHLGAVAAGRHLAAPCVGSLEHLGEVSAGIAFGQGRRAAVAGVGQGADAAPLGVGDLE